MTFFRQRLCCCYVQLSKCAKARKVSFSPATHESFDEKSLPLNLNENSHRYEIKYLRNRCAPEAHPCSFYGFARGGIGVICYALGALRAKFGAPLQLCDRC